jgi:hypothetical protein
MDTFNREAGYVLPLSGSNIENAAPWPRRSEILIVSPWAWATAATNDNPTRGVDAVFPPEHSHGDPLWDA